MLDSVEIHKSVELLADTCVIKLPGAVYNHALKIEDEQGKDRIKRGDVVIVKLGYDNKLKEEFRGYVLSLSTDDDSVVINCEDDLFLLRKKVADKEFVNVRIRDIAQYLIDQTKAGIGLKCGFDERTPMYQKFVISNATAYDVLKKLQDETKANIYLTGGNLCIFPPMIEKGGEVAYSFQYNIEQSDLKYKRAEDRQIQITVSYVGKDGQKKEYKYGTTGGDNIPISGDGFNEEYIKHLAKDTYDKNMYDGYDGSITGWLIPFVQPTYTAQIKDEDYEYKEGKYYVTSVTTSVSSSGGSRKVELGKRLL